MRGRKVWFGKWKGLYMLEAIHKQGHWFEWCLGNLDWFKPTEEEMEYYRKRAMAVSAWYEEYGVHHYKNEPIPLWESVDNWIIRRFDKMPTIEELKEIWECEKKRTASIGTDNFISFLSGLSRSLRNEVDYYEEDYDGLCEGDFF